MSDPIIEIRNISFGYHVDQPTLENISLTLDAGQSCCIVGPNGGGKSTLLKLMLGLLSPDSGTIRIFGVTPEAARRRIGYMPQYHQLDAAFPVSVLEVAMMGRITPRTLLRYSKADKKAALDALAELDIADLAECSFAALSGGQRQRVLIARAIASMPDLLLLDEPTANIDPKAEEHFYQTLEVLRQRMTVVTVSHDLGFVSRETDLIVCVNKSLSIHHAADFNAKNVDELYHHHVGMIQHDHSCFCHCENEERQ